MAKRKTTRRGKKSVTISLTRVAQLGWAYQSISGNNLGEVMDRAIQAIMNDQGDIATILLEEVNQTLANVSQNGVQIAIKTGLGVGAFQYLGSIIGHKVIFKVGKFRLTV